MFSAGRVPSVECSIKSARNKIAHDERLLYVEYFRRCLSDVGWHHRLVVDPWAA